MSLHQKTSPTSSSSSHSDTMEESHATKKSPLNASSSYSSLPLNSMQQVCCGYLFKKPEKNSLLWKKRYCILYEGQLHIYYYENPDKVKSGQVKGKIPFGSVHRWDGKPHGIQFYTPSSKCYRLYCDSDEEREMWISNMQQQLDKAPESCEGEVVPRLRPIASKAQEDTDEGIIRGQSWRGEAMDTQWMMQELQDLRSEVTSLRGTVVAYERIEKISPNGKIPNLAINSRESVLSDGTEVAIRPSELETMRQIFNLFAKHDSHYIDADDLRELHRKLGEPITQLEAEEALGYINPKNKKIDFVAFIKWWTEDHKINDQNEQMKRYKAKFKFLKARIANPAIGRVELESVGAYPSFEFRLKFFYNGEDGTRVQISPWHDIPLYNSNGTVNFICEIPKWTRKKMEIATGEPYNPIKQDTKNGKLREYTWGDMMFNYGALPQTWEDPEHTTEGTGCIGDNDPIDVVEIGTKQWRTGAVVQVKILGVLALIDDGETDWKVLCINVQDHYAPMINDVADIEAHMPGCVTAIHDWLRDYKLPHVNQYGFNGMCMNREFAEAVVAETHEFWKGLVEERGGMATV